jgi:GntR family transcriptional regulator
MADLRAESHDAIIHSIMFARVDTADRTPLHDQVAAQIRRSIAEGDASPGDRLPPAKDLAAVMHVNTNTVLRALRALRDEGLLEFRRGMGVRVSGTPQQGAVVARARELLAFARNEGYKPEELIAIIQGLR